MKLSRDMVIDLKVNTYLKPCLRKIAIQGNYSFQLAWKKKKTTIGEGYVFKNLDCFRGLGTYIIY